MNEGSSSHFDFKTYLNKNNNGGNHLDSSIIELQGHKKKCKFHWDFINLENLAVNP